jgi:putative ABC transport system permease protein
MDMGTKSLGRRGTHQYQAIGRLKPGFTLQQAQAEMTLIASRLEQQYPDSNYKAGASLVGLHEDLVGESRSSLMTMLWAVALVLLIACANIANLLLSRAVARQKEMAIRGALGAGRRRLIRQVLTESVLLAGMGAIAGLALAWIAIRVITSLKHLGLPTANVIEIDPGVLGFTLALAVITGILFGIVPALQISGSGFYEELKGSAGTSSAGRKRRGASNVLVVGEVGLSLLLLICAGLLLKDFMRLRSTEIGVRPQGVWTAAIFLPDAKYHEDQQQFDFGENLLERVKHLPGVESAALSNRLPLEGGSNGYVAIRGKPFQPMSGPLVETHAVTPDYFKVLGIPVLQGRTFTEEDEKAALLSDEQDEKRSKANIKLPPEQTDTMIRPAIINEAMVKEFWPHENPLGKLFSYGAKNGPWLQVVGVTGDVKQWSITHAPVPEAYVPFGGQYLVLLVHTASTDMNVSSAVRHALAEIDSSIPLYLERTMNDIIAQHATGQQFLAMLIGLFSGLALVLAAVGIYGVLSYLVTQRTREIGIRMSLGASRERVLGLVLKEGMRLAGIGFALGLVGALAAGRLMSSLLHQVRPSDPAVIVLTAVCLGLVALIACYLPARRAARVDPMVALRHE